MQPTPLTERHYYEGTHANPRWIAELYCLWRLCPRSACRRARACRDDAQRCMSGLALVPPDALDFLVCFDDAREDGLTFEEMIDLHGEELDALEQWRAQVALSVS